MQVDAIELQTAATSDDGDDFDMDPSQEEGYMQQNVAAADNTDEEYETWEGFGSGTHLTNPSSTSPLTLNHSTQRHRWVKPEMQRAAQGKY